MGWERWMVGQIPLPSKQKKCSNATSQRRKIKKRKGKRNMSAVGCCEAAIKNGGTDSDETFAALCCLHHRHRRAESQARPSQVQRKLRSC